MKRYKDFYKAWWYLEEHKYFKDKNGLSRFQQALDIEVVKVNPKTKEVDDNKKLNTEIDIWLECGRLCEDDETFGTIFEHNLDMDCGAKTFEKAIMKLANIVYNLDREGKLK